MFKNKTLKCISTQLENEILELKAKSTGTNPVIYTFFKVNVFGWSIIILKWVKYNFFATI
jgi:hypothetical protein